MTLTLLIDLFSKQRFLISDLCIFGTPRRLATRVPRRGDSTMIRRVCATGVLNLPPCSGVGKPKKDTLFWSYHSFLKSIVLYCIVLKTKTIFMLYLFNQMILPFHFSSVMFVQNSVKFSVTVISLSYDKCSAF